VIPPRTFRLGSLYVAQILKGEKRANLPVQQATQVEARHQLEDRQGALDL
jgi:hypothetical protein